MTWFGDPMLRRNPDGTVYTWLMVDRATGQSVLVDDRTFDPAFHAQPPGPGDGADADAVEVVAVPPTRRRRKVAA